MTYEEVLESNRGRPDGSSEGESMLSGFVEKGAHDPLHGTEAESSDKSIIVIEDKDKYTQSETNNDSLPNGMK